MTPEIARIIASMSPIERAMYVRMGGRIPVGTPKPLIIWRRKDVHPWAVDVKRKAEAE